MWGEDLKEGPISDRENLLGMIGKFHCYLTTSSSSTKTHEGLGAHLLSRGL